MNSNAGPVRQSPTGDGSRWVKGQRIVGAERQALADDLVERYSHGESIRTIASSIERSYGFVNRMLRESGVSLRSRGGARQRRTGRTEQHGGTSTRVPATTPVFPQE